MHRSSTYKPGLAWFAALGSVWVFVLVALGAFTTTIGAGMAFPDWPLSNGSVNPHGWLTEIDKFAEHSHRISASVMGTITIFTAVWLWRTEERAWLRKLGWFAVGLVIFQGVVGGLRVLLDHFQVSMVDTSVGRLFAMLHAFLAQAFVCTLFAIAFACSRPWIEHEAGLIGSPSARLRRIGVTCVILLFVQLSIAAIVRHSFAGLAIPTFPASTPEGNLLPAAWDFRVFIQFAHRTMAAVIGLAILVYGHFLFRERNAAPFLRGMSFMIVALICLQITLGAQIIWTGRSVYMTTGHVVIGALTLATVFVTTFALH
ncbi:MAG TPA: COX15/CtaA family protein, partial [Candidatus Didemnitutus sp.]|nr:COX15/CtaA family protein [Candidatus Didemnitutus sp.]